MIKDVTYNGKAKTPTVVAKIGSTTIDPAEYEVKYSNNVKPGVATVTITGLNNFYGTKKVTFNILPERVAGLQFVTSTTSAVRVSGIRSNMRPVMLYITVKMARVIRSLELQSIRQWFCQSLQVDRHIK